MKINLKSHNISYTEQYDGWIKKVTRKMYLKYNGFYPFSDLLSVAYITSVEAERKYDADKAKFSTFIKPRIEGAIIRAMSNITNSQHQDLKKMYRFIDSYIEKHGRVPAMHIILKDIGISEKRFMILISIANAEQYVPIEEAEEGIDTSVDLDTLAEFSRIEELVATFPQADRKLLRRYLDDPEMPDEAIAGVVNKLRKKLGIEETT